jgi:hypothetical protein
MSTSRIPADLFEAPSLEVLVLIVAIDGAAIKVIRGVLLGDASWMTRRTHPIGSVRRDSRRIGWIPAGAKDVGFNDLTL